MLFLRVKQENLEFLDEMGCLEKKEYLDYQESRCVSYYAPASVFCFS